MENEQTKCKNRNSDRPEKVPRWWSDGDACDSPRQERRLYCLVCYHYPGLESVVWLWPVHRRWNQITSHTNVVLIYIHLNSHIYIHTHTPTHTHTYTHTYTYPHTYIYTHIHLPTHILIHTHTPTHTYTYIHTHTPTHTHTYIHTHTPTHTHTYIHTHTPTHTHTYIHTHTPTHTYTCTYTYPHIYIYTHTYTYPTHTPTHTITYIHTHIHLAIQQIIIVHFGLVRLVVQASALRAGLGFKSHLRCIFPGQVIPVT